VPSWFNKIRGGLASFGRNHLTTQLVRFAGDRSGNVAMMFGLTAIMLFIAIGGALDFGRWAHASVQTKAAMDAAVLRGGRALQTNNEDTAAAVAAAEAFYRENVKTRVKLISDSITFEVVDGGTAMTAGGQAFIETTFLKLANIDQLPLVDQSGADYSKATLAVGGSGGESLEVSMMLDVTGSMCSPCTKLEDLKEAAKDLVDIVVWDDQSEYTAKIALVPFSEDILLPTSALDAARGTGLPQSKTVTYWRRGELRSRTYWRSDCVVERTGSEKYTDAAPGFGAYVMAHYTASSTGSGSDRKGVCSIPSNAEVVPLTDDKTSLKATIDGFSAGGYTAGHLGTAWSFYTLSPDWGSLWSSDSQPQPYGTENLKKIAILMTDGEFNTQYDANGISTRDRGAGAAANADSATQARALCNSMKAQGITVYTVGFELGGESSESYQTLYQCATNPGHFYNAEDGEQLKQAFRDIALKLSSLYLSK
jgi:Flp pilus assembly protein TadG